MADISSVIVARTDQINADDLVGKTLVITIAEVILKGGQEQPVSIKLVGNDKFYRPCKLMCRVMAKAWTNETANWVGKSARLYCDPKVKFGPLEVGGVRISHLSHIDDDMLTALQVRKGVKAGFLVKPLIMESTKPAEPEFTESDARADLEAATTLDELSTAWRRRIMAPHRDALADVLAELKSKIAAVADERQGRTDEHHGDQHDGTQGN